MIHAHLLFAIVIASALAVFPVAAYSDSTNSPSVTGKDIHGNPIGTNVQGNTNDKNAQGNRPKDAQGNAPKDMYGNKTGTENK